MPSRPKPLIVRANVTYRQKDDGRANGYGTQWIKARASYLKAHRLCVACEAEGRVEIASDVDHIIPHRKRQEVFWDSDRWQPLCARCHGLKTGRYDRHYQPMDERKRVVVCGEPGSGKTTWIEQQRKPGDLVYDMDAIAAVMFACPKYPRPDHVMNAMLSVRRWCVSQANLMHCDVWMIVTDETEAAIIAKEIGGSVVRMRRKSL